MNINDDALVNFTVPEDNDKIWRYMDFTKFVSLLCDGALFFSRVDNFEDPLEGCFPLPNKEYLNCLKKITEGDEKSLQIIENHKFITENIRKFAFVNCWHINEYQSAAMWKLYSKNDNGIAIQSTYGRLKNCLKKVNREINIYKVRYIDFYNESITFNILNPFFYKRLSFEYEKELRTLIFEPFSNIDKLSIENIDPLEKALKNEVLKPGINIENVDLELLIERVYISPTSPKWVEKVVVELTERFGIKTLIVPSGLYENILY